MKADSLARSLDPQISEGYSFAQQTVGTPMHSLAELISVAVQDLACIELSVRLQISPQGRLCGCSTHAIPQPGASPCFQPLKPSPVQQNIPEGGLAKPNRRLVLCRGLIPGLPPSTTSTQVYKSGPPEPGTWLNFLNTVMICLSSFPFSLSPHHLKKKKTKEGGR